MTPYAFVHETSTRMNSIKWPDFWYMQIDRRQVLIPLRDADAPTHAKGFRMFTLYTNADQVRTYVKMLHQGKRNNYYPI